MTPSPHTAKSTKNTSFLRVLLLITLSLTGLATAGLSYYFIRHSQALFAESQFFGMVNDHFKSTKQAFKLLLQANDAVATAFSTMCPTAADWPNCEISSIDLLSRVSPLVAMSGVLLFTAGPIVRPDDRRSFEEFAANYYANDGGYAPGTGRSGIYFYDGDSMIKSPNHTDPSTQRYDILVPVLYASTPYYFLDDAYGDPTLRPTVDEILECVNVTSGQHPSCSAISNFIPTEINSAIGTPIIPRNDPAGNVVGFVAAIFSWETLFSSAVQEYFDFQFSIQADSSPIILTFKISKGVAHATTSITHYPPSSDGFWKQSKQSFILDPDGILVKETKYTLTYYSSDTSGSPLFAVVAGVCCLGITLIISLIFVIFNTLMAKAALDASTLLDLKRTYVRFVSHEIRSIISLPSPSPRCSLLLEPL
jgi:hypothetical protein